MKTVDEERLRQMKLLLLEKGTIIMPEWAATALRDDAALKGELTFIRTGSHSMVQVMWEPGAWVRSTVEACAEREGLRSYDTALPQAWVDNMASRGFGDVRGHFVWSYDSGNIFGCPYPITLDGRRMAGMAAGTI